MITSAGEIVRIKEIVREAETELEKEGIPYRRIKQGIMIETPAAALISDELAGMADFFSIGTNDLTQYTLAVDRLNRSMAPFYEPHHKAVLRMIEMTVRNAHKAGIKASICGELAYDKELTAGFIKMGVDALSIPPGKILELRKYICGL
jgi:phosphotransferase system enzyme I (PtsI)